LPDNRAGRQTVNKAKTVATNKTDKNPNQKFSAMCAEMVKENNQVCVDRFNQLVEKHGYHNVIMFAVNKQNLLALDLSAGLSGQSIHKYAKEAALQWAETDCDQHVHDIKNGKAVVKKVAKKP
jgi:hypothetical protein